MRRTDFLDVGSLESERMHAYEASESESAGPVTAHPEGEWLFTSSTERGRTHAGGTIRFAVAIDPHNRGVRLRRRLDQKSSPQEARVFVDGEFAGTWYDADHNPHRRWFDSDLDLHPRWTRGKERLQIRLEVVTGGGRGAFTDFVYEVFCHEVRQ
jgi:hypothetical protein